MATYVALLCGTALAAASSPPVVLPRTCAADSPTKHSAWCDSSKTFHERAASLVAELTLAEKSQLFNVVCMLGYVERLNLKGTHWDSTCIHGVSNAGNATVFPHAINLGASFDRDLVARVGLATSAEMRSISAAAYSNGGKAYNNVCDGGPLANTAHDPRWGRISETYGEDPYLVQEIGTTAMLALQNRTTGPRGEEYLSVPQVTRHFIGYHGAKPDLPKPFMNVSTRDLYEAYLPNFEAFMVGGRAEGVMCGYAALNGVPSCQNELLLKTMLRDDWKSDALVQTDCCDSMFDWVGTYFDTREEAFRSAVGAGVSLYYGYAPQDTITYWNGSIANGTLKETQLDAAAERVLLTRFRAGEFDEDHPFISHDVPTGVVNSPAHRALARETAAKTAVLLANSDGVLPLDLKETLLGAAASSRVLVTGPFAHCTDITAKGRGGYGETNCYAHSYSGIPSQVVTVFDALRTAAAASTGGSATVSYEKGSNETSGSEDMVSAAVAAAKGTDVVVLCVGSGAQIEAEGRDRTALSLPGNQTALLDALRAALEESSTKLVILLFTAGGVPLEVKTGTKGGEALVYVGYPGQETGSGMVDVLTGAVNPSARLPLTVYPEAYLDEIGPISDFDVSKGVGRTYRYLDESKVSPVYRFGYGLSYTTFKYGGLSLAAAAAGNVSAEVDVTNTGSVEGAEVVQMYITLPPQPGREVLPISSLCAFDKVTLKPGAIARVELQCSGYALQVVKSDGSRVAAVGNAQIHVGGYSPGGSAATTGSVVGSVALPVEGSLAQFV